MQAVYHFGPSVIHVRWILQVELSDHLSGNSQSMCELLAWLVRRGIVQMVVLVRLDFVPSLAKAWGRGGT